MSNFHRLIWIDGQIRAGRFPNSRSIAQEFEISRRQASRDIEYLRYSLGAPIEYCPRNNGYFYVKDTFVLPAQFISQEEKNSLEYLAHQYRGLKSSHALQLADLFSRLAQGHTDGSGKVAVLTSSPDEAKAYQVLGEAIESRCKVELEYISQANQTKRVVCPYLQFSRNGRSYVVGFCELRQDIRSFRLCRIEKIRILEQGFTVVPWFDAAAYKDGFDYREPYLAQVSFGTPLNSSELRTRSLGGDRYEITFTQADKLLTSLLGGGDFSIISPKWLRLRLQQRLFKLMQHNFPGSDTICPTPLGKMAVEPNGGDENMAKKLDAKVGMCWTSFIGSVDGVLRHGGLWEDDMYKLMGMTGMAFHFIIHKTACPSSVTVYDWAAEHMQMLDRIGIHSQVVQVFRDPKLNTFEMVQADAIEAVKASLDRDMAVVTWAPTGLLEFGIITGYDDEDQVFFVQDCANPDADPLRYTNLGVSEVPYLYVHIFKGKVDVDTEKIYRESLEFGLAEWNREEAAPDYARGRKGYEYLLDTLERGDFNPFGLVYCLNVYSDSKCCIARYLDFVSKQSQKGLAPAVDLFQQVADNFLEITKLLPFGMDLKELGPEKVRAVQALVKESFALEDKAMAVVKATLE